MEHQGGKVLRLGRFWDPPALNVKRVRVYGGTTFVLVLQEKLGFELCTPADDLILSLPPEALRRRIQKQGLQEAEHFQYPLFVKPVIPKLFAAHVYTDIVELRGGGIERMSGRPRMAVHRRCVRLTAG